MVQKKRILGSILLSLWLLATICSNAESTVKRSDPVAMVNEKLIRVKIHQLIMDPTSRQPIVYLSDAEEKRALLIWIGFPEARAIYAELHGIKNLRPLTHDLLARIIRKVNGKLHHVVITHAEKNVYYATIVIEKDGTLAEVDARPSDSIVMALKFKAPLYVSVALFEKMSLPVQDQTEIEEEYGLTLQELTPELAKYLSFQSNQGVLVSSVYKGSRAEKDGIETGDIIVALAGQAVENVLSLKGALAKSKAPVTVKIFRKSRYLKIILHKERR